MTLVATLAWFAVLVSPLLVPMLAEASTAPYLRPPFVDQPNLVVCRVESPAPHRAYLALGDGWGDVQFVDGKPWRAVPACATLRIVAHASQARTVRITARVASGTAAMEVIGSASPLRASLSTFPSTLEATVIGVADLTISAPVQIMVEGLELAQQ